MAKSRAEAARKAAAAINKAFLRKGGDRPVIFTGTDLPSPLRAPTGILSLDWMMGGGIPRGNFSCLWGPEGAGKTSICLMMVAQCQRLDPDFVCLWLDGSQRFSAMQTYAMSLGVDMTRFFPVLAATVEEAIEVARQMANEDCIDMIVVDDLAVYSSMKELYKKSTIGSEREITEQTVGAQALANGHFIRSITPLINRKQIACMFTQQVRANMDMSNTQYDMPGGHALKHILVWSGFLRPGPMKDAPSIGSTLAGEKCGFSVVLKTSKMSLDSAQPTGSQLTTQWVTGQGIDPGRDAYCFLEGRGLVAASGASRKFAAEINELFGLPSDNSFKGRAACEEFLAENSRKLYEHFVPNLELQVQSGAVKEVTLDTMSSDEPEIIEDEGEVV